MHAQSKTSQFQALLKMRASRSPWTHAINPAITRTTIQFIDDGLSTAKLTLWDERIKTTSFHYRKWTLRNRSNNTSKSGTYNQQNTKNFRDIAEQHEVLVITDVT